MKIGDILKVIPDTINALSNAPKNLAEGCSITIDNFRKIPGTIDEYSKKFEEHVDRNNERMLNKIQRAKVKLNEEQKKI